jgi:hypothetical protein
MTNGVLGGELVDQRADEGDIVHPGPVSVGVVPVGPTPLDPLACVERAQPPRVRTRRTARTDERIRRVFTATISPWRKYVGMIR